MVIQKSDISFVDNSLTPELMSQFRRAAGWPDQPKHQYKKAFDNSLFSVTAVYNNKVVGIGRLIGDGAMDFYVKDIIILPKQLGFRVRPNTHEGAGMIMKVAIREGPDD